MDGERIGQAILHLDNEGIDVGWPDERRLYALSGTEAVRFLPAYILRGRVFLHAIPKSPLLVTRNASQGV